MKAINHCDEYEAQCHETEYHHFDDVCGNELALCLSADDVLNQSSFRATLHLDRIAGHEGKSFPGLDHYLNSLKGKVGVYHLWSGAEFCQSHRTYLLRCVYVGKGYPRRRVKAHVGKEWLEQKLPLCVSFFECENRVAKYLEQLFLDKYRFALNTAESKGTVPLFARWREERFMPRTGAHAGGDGRHRNGPQR
jgi:hypothetical protein